MEAIYRRFLTALPIANSTADDHLHLLSPVELAGIKRTERWAVIAAVIIELAAYLLIFLPIYEFHDLFEASNLPIGGPFGETEGRFPWLRSAWMLAVTVFELYLLLLMNLAAVHGVAVATGYIRSLQGFDPTHVSHLIAIALERQPRDQEAFGIDPFQDLRPWALYLFLAIGRLKGLIGSALARAALTNLFGREILRVYLDFSGMPIYMAINALTSMGILRNARVVIMGQAAIERLGTQLPSWRLGPDEQRLIYDTLQFIAINKRDYHVNHYHLTRMVVERYDIPVRSRHHLAPGYEERFARARPDVADLCKLLVVLGFILDGRLSWRERRQAKKLREAGVLDLSDAALDYYCRGFLGGRGLDEPVGRFLGVWQFKVTGTL